MRCPGIDTVYERFVYPLIPRCILFKPCHNTIRKSSQSRPTFVCFNKLASNFSPQSQNLTIKYKRIAHDGNLKEILASGLKC